MNISEILPILLSSVVQWFLYTILAWMLIRLQGAKCNFFLPFATAAAVATTFVPNYGIFISFAVLLVLLPFATKKARFVPHVVFTVIISGGVIYALNVWVLPSLMEQAVAKATHLLEVAAAEVEKSEEATATEEGETAEAGEETSVVATNLPPPEPPPIPRVWQHESGLSVRGISYSKRRPLAMLALDGQVLTLGPGESLSLETRDGLVRARCVAVERDHVRVEFESGEKVDLLLD